MLSLVARLHLVFVSRFKCFHWSLLYVYLHGHNMSHVTCFLRQLHWKVPPSVRRIIADFSSSFIVTSDISIRGGFCPRFHALWGYSLSCSVQSALFDCSSSSSTSGRYRSISGISLLHVRQKLSDIDLGWRELKTTTSSENFTQNGTKSNRATISFVTRSVITLR